MNEFDNRYTAARGNLRSLVVQGTDEGSHEVDGLERLDVTDVQLGAVALGLVVELRQEILQLRVDLTDRQEADLELFRVLQLLRDTSDRLQHSVRIARLSVGRNETHRLRISAGLVDLVRRVDQLMRHRRTFVRLQLGDDLFRVVGGDVRVRRHLMSEGENVDSVFVILRRFVRKRDHLFLQILDASQTARAVSRLHRPADVHTENEVVALVEFEIVRIRHVCVLWRLHAGYEVTLTSKYG